jgi:hypothetical protein
MRKPAFLIIVIFTVLMFALVPQLLAQTQDKDRSASGSFYSGIGFGSPVDNLSPFSMGMGLSGVSNYSGTVVSTSNPAHLALISFSQGNVSAVLNQYEASDLSRTARNAFFGLQNFQIAFPILRNKLGFSLAFSPSYRADFSKREQGRISPVEGVTSANVDYALDTIGSGGINKIEASFGYRFTNSIAFGYGFGVNLMSLNTEVRPIFSDLQFRTTPFTSSTTGSNISHRFGIHAFTSGLFSNNDQIAFGATITLPFAIDAERSVSAFRNINNQRTRIELNENLPDRNGTIKLPLEFNTGLTYNLNRFVNIASELMIQKWDNAEYSFNETQQEYFKDRVRAGLGFQYHPYRADGVLGFFSNFKYSAGATYDTGHLAINGQDIETVFLNAGIGIMSDRSASSIDLSFHYGIRGTESSNLVKENIWGFKISLNMAEIMFLRQRFQ